MHPWKEPVATYVVPMPHTTGSANLTHHEVIEGITVVPATKSIRPVPEGLTNLQNKDILEKKFGS